MGELKTVHEAARIGTKKKMQPQRRRDTEKSKSIIIYQRVHSVPLCLRGNSSGWIITPDEWGQLFSRRPIGKALTP